MKTVEAIFENGVFRPTEPVDLPDNTAVDLAIRVDDQPPPMSEGLARVYAILGERFDSGQADTAARHDEHQP